MQTSSLLTLSKRSLKCITSASLKQNTRKYASKVKKGTKQPEPIKERLVVKQNNGGGGGIGKILLLGALVTPPVYVLYKTRTDEKFREDFGAQFPSVYETVKSISGIDDSNNTNKSILKSEDIGSIKKELDELEERWKISGTHEENFSPAEVEELTKQIEEIKLKARNSKKRVINVEKVKCRKSSDTKSTITTTDSKSNESREEEVDTSESEEKDEVSSPKKTSRNELNAIRDKARNVKSIADKNADKSIKKIEKELRGDLETVLSHDLTHLDEEGLRSRIVQLVLEIKDRNRWEALRLYELTKKHTDDLVQKYDDIIREQMDHYEELVRTSSADSVARATEETKQRMDDQFNRVMFKKEQQWQQITMQKLDIQRQELGKEMENRINSAKLSFEARAAEDLKARVSQLNEFKGQINKLKAALGKYTKAESSSGQVQAMSSCLLELQSTLYNNPSQIGLSIKRLERAAKGDKTVETTLNSMPERIKSNGIPHLIDLVQRFDTVYDNCYRVAMLPDDAGVVEHALARIAAGLTIRGGPVGSTAESQQDHLNKAKEILETTHDLNGTLAELSHLQGAAKESATDWVTSAQDILTVQQAISLIQYHLNSISKK